MSEGLSFCIISDFFVEDGYPWGIGGAALNDEEIYKHLSKTNEVIKKKSEKLTLEEIASLKEKGFKFIVSNFFNLSKDVKEYIQENCDYLLYVHDYKFVDHTNPAVYDNFIVPKDELINVDFHLNSKRIICQSELQKGIYDKNLSSEKITYNLSGNLWNESSFKVIKETVNKPKNGKVAVVKSLFPQKGTPEAIKLCINKRFDYDLIHNEDPQSFLEELGQFSALAFVPFTPETLSRVCVESKMMGLEVYTTDLVGASHEPWFNLKGQDLISLMENKINDAHSAITTSF